jgi:hypothetical protein
MAVETGAPESGAPDEADPESGIRLWFRSLLRSLLVILATLAVLAVLGFAADVALHRVVRTSHSSSNYTNISTVEIVLDGDGSVSLTGTPRGAARTSAVGISETDSSTVFDHPDRIIDRIGGMLFISVHCPDSLCSADLAVTVPATVPVTLSVGDALRLDRAKVTVSGMSGPIDLTAWPAEVSIADSTSTVTGEVAGSISCAAPSVCIIQQIG